MNKRIAILSLLFSQAAFANVSEGVIAQVDCHQEKGIGIAEIRTVEKDTLFSTWVKVKSDHLCKGERSPLVNRGFKNLSELNLTVDTFTYDKEGFLTDFKPDRIVSVEVMKDVSIHLQVNSKEVHDWYFENRFH